MDKINKNLFNYILCIGMSILITLILLNFFITPLIVQGESMEPTIHNRSFVIASKPAAKDIERFDIVTAKVDGKLLIKRVIGLPGEIIEYKDNQLYINGESIQEEYLGEDVETCDFIYQVPLGSYFLLGDNREVSLDSRYYGDFAKKNIVASDIIVLFPFLSFGKAE